MAAQDLDKLDIQGLEALIERARSAKERLREQRRQELRTEFERRSTSEGFTLMEIVATRSKAKRTPKYAHPTDPGKTWTGLGRVPKWLSEIAKDGDMERFRVSGR